nr:hypothetical protein CFP56_07382 [Quercus suber]
MGEKRGVSVADCGAINYVVPARLSALCCCRMVVLSLDVDDWMRRVSVTLSYLNMEVNLSASSNDARRVLHILTPRPR